MSLLRRAYSLTTIAALVGCSLVYDTTSLTGGDGEADASAGRGGGAGSGGSPAIAGSAGSTGSSGGNAGTASSKGGSGSGGSGGSGASIAGGGNEELGGSAGEASGCDSVWYVDADGDGYGDEVAPQGCTTTGTVQVGGDCDDGEALINPGLGELCDGLDNDCDPLTTDVCPLDCETDTEGHVYMFCWVPQTAPAASATCAEQHMRLVRFDDEAEQDYVYSWHQPSHSWAGGSDVAAEGTWKWEDGDVFWDQGTAQLYSAWGDGEPNNLSSSEHYLMLNGDWNHWNDHDGNDPQGFSCERY